MKIGSNYYLRLFLQNIKKEIQDWIQGTLNLIDKNDYFDAMKESYINDNKIKKLLYGALTSDIDNRELFMKGIDTSYYYEEDD